jgi:phasin family protein
MSNPNSEFEQVSVAQKASAEVLMSIMRSSFEGMQRLTALNVAAARELYSNSVATSGKFASSKDMSEVARVNQQLAKPERLIEYWRSVYDVVSGMQKEVSAVMQANYGQLTKLAASAIEQKKSSAVDGGDMMAGVMKNMLEQTNKAFDNMTAHRQGEYPGRYNGNGKSDWVGNRNQQQEINGPNGSAQEPAETVKNAEPARITILNHACGR